MKLIFSIPFLLLALSSFSQNMLTEKAFIEVVKKYHPVIKQSQLKIKASKANVTQSRSAFDPVIKTDYEQKKIGGLNYYQYYNPKIEIPTWLGIEAYAGIERAYGNYINPENTSGEISYAGVSIPVMKNFLMDNRRSQLQQAKIFVLQTEEEQKIIINNLLNEALFSYWEWVNNFRNLSIIKQLIINATNRFEFVKQECYHGNKPAMDTIEALAQLQSYWLYEQDARLKFQKSQFELSNYLWEETTPAKIIDNTIPSDSISFQSDINIATETLNIVSTLQSHPKISATQLKIKGLKVERLLKQQYILPKLDIKANLINKGRFEYVNLTSPYLQNNFKYAINFSFPLRLSEGRAQIKLANIKILETEYDISNYSWQIENKLKQSLMSIAQIKNQIIIQQNAIKNYQLLFSNEQIKYEQGESSLFLINSREIKLLESQIKLNDLYCKYRQSIIYYKNNAGTLYQYF